MTDYYHRFPFLLLCCLRYAGMSIMFSVVVLVLCVAIAVMATLATNSVIGYYAYVHRIYVPVDIGVDQGKPRNVD